MVLQRGGGPPSRFQPRRRIATRWGGRALARHARPPGIGGYATAQSTISDSSGSRRKCQARRPPHISAVDLVGVEHWAARRQQRGPGRPGHPRRVGQHGVPRPAGVDDPGRTCRLHPPRRVPLLLQGGRGRTAPSSRFWPSASSTGGSRASGRSATRRSCAPGPNEGHFGHSRSGRGRCWPYAAGLAPG